MADISVVVVAKNEEKHIENCLKRLKKQKVKPEIIVVDGHSTDKTVKIARKYGKVFFDDKTGVGEARNIGCKKASSNIVAYCDADSRPPKDWTERILKIMGENIAISGPIYPYDGRKTIGYNLKLWTKYAFSFMNLIRFPCFNGANMVFKRSVLLKNPFRCNLLEDFDRGLRLRKKGKVKYFPSLEMFISSRRFQKGFYKVAFGTYVPNMIRVILKGTTKDGVYWV